MKKLAVNKEAVCMNCLTCELECAAAFYKNEDRLKFDYSCIHVVPKDSKVKIVACVQCGKCAESCEKKAISQNAKGVFTIDKKKCENCGKCADACPFKVMVKAPNKETPSKCIACGICAKSCPQGVLYIKEKDAA